jgi:hypothetical protein
LFNKLRIAPSLQQELEKKGYPKTETYHIINITTCEDSGLNPNQLILTQIALKSALEVWETLTSPDTTPTISQDSPSHFTPTPASIYTEQLRKKEATAAREETILLGPDAQAIVPQSQRTLRDPDPTTTFEIPQTQQLQKITAPGKKRRIT